jgi:heme o synthase
LLTAGWLLVTARQLHVRSSHGEPVEPLRLFQRCNAYLAAVFCALAVDSALALPTLLGH